MRITQTHKAVIKAVLQDIIPTREDVKHMKTVQQDLLKKLSFPKLKTKLGGSGAKNTWLKNTHDIDVYVTFPYAQYKERSANISGLLYKLLKKKFSKVTKLHGSRDYFQIKYKQYTVEIIPILGITKPTQARNITDFSQFHVQYVTKYLRKKKTLAQDIRLAKVFTQAHEVYGAESYIKGLSGYVLELLVIHYGSFLKLVQAAAQWKTTTTIGNAREAARLNWAKKLSPLRLIDPTQPDRNAAAALSPAQYQLFVKLCKQFMNKPRGALFTAQPIDVTKLKKKGHLTVIHVTPLVTKRDIAGAKALKAFEYVVGNLELYDVITSHFSFTQEQATFYIVTKQRKLSADTKQRGPPVKQTKDVAAFKKAHKKHILKIDKKEQRYYVLQPRKHKTLHALLRDLLARDEVTTRVSTVTFLTS